MIIINTSKDIFKSKQFKISSYLKINIFEYLLYIVCQGVSIALALVIPFYLGNCVDYINSPHNIVSVKYYICRFCIFIAAELIFSIALNILNVRLSNKVAFQLEFDVLKHIKYTRYSEINQFNDTYLAQRINNDAVCIGDYVIEKLTIFAADVIQAFFLILYIFYINIGLGFLIMAVIGVYVAIYLISRRILYKRNMCMVEAQSNFFSMLGNQLFNILTIKINAWYEETDSEFQKVVTAFFDKSVRFLRIHMSLESGNIFLSRTAYGCAILMLGIAVAKGNVSMGTLSIIVIFVQLLLNKIQSISGFGKNRELYRVAKDRITELINLRQEHNGDVKLTHIDSIAVHNITVSYQSKTVFSNKSMNLNKGKLYLLCGENGAGKTTFLYAALGILDVEEGEVRYNDINIKDIDMYSARKDVIAVSQQNPMLQNTTIYDNITYGLKENTVLDDAQKNVINKLLSFTDKLEHGMETVIQSKQCALSGGEIRRIAVCRTLLKKADVFILDEPTNDLDQDGVHSLLSLLNEMKRSHIIIVVSHDERLQRLADEVLYFT